jgi:hypothetical protein
MGSDMSITMSLRRSGVVWWEITATCIDDEQTEGNKRRRRKEKKRKV